MPLCGTLVGGDFNPTSFAYVVVRVEWSGPKIVSRHRTRESAEKALPVGPSLEHGCYVYPVECNRLGTPLPVRLGERVNVVNGIVVPGRHVPR